jgi:hypothetical protein
LLKRDSKERRKFGSRTRFPMVDSSGCEVPANRSRQPERRLNNYVIEEISAREFLLRCFANRRRRGN